MDARQKAEPRKRKQNECEARHRSPGEFPAALGKSPMKQQQAKIKSPNDQRPDDLGIGPIPCSRWKAERKCSYEQSDREQNEPAQQEPDCDQLQSLDGWNEGQKGAHAMKLKVVFLVQVHDRCQRTEAERSIRQENERCMETLPATAEVGLGGLF